MPTKPEQSDVNMLTRGGNGDYPHIVVAPGDPVEAFQYSVLATNLARRAQCPVIIALDALCHDNFTVPRFDLSAITVDHGKRLSVEEVAKLAEYKRYAITDDGISPMAFPGTPGGMNLVTGNERDEWGRVTTEPVNRVKMVDKRSRKIETVKPSLPRALEWGDTQSPLGIICVGILGGVLAEALPAMAEKGYNFHCHRPRTLWPVLQDTIDFVNSHEKVYVIEQSEGRQLAGLLQSAGANANNIVSILKYDGLQFTANEMARLVLAKERQS
jgi:2-oxoglutarate ferredoxin oxidoreductase subunit alpha